MNKEQKELIKIINKAYDDLYILDNITWTSYRKDLLKHNIKEERSHRNFGNDWVMTEINAILGIHQLTYLNNSVKRRNEIAKKYTKALSTVSKINIIEVPSNQICAYYKYQIILDKSINNEKFKDVLLKKHGIKLGAVV